MKKTLNLFLCLLVLSLVACDEDELTNQKLQKGKLVKTVTVTRATLCSDRSIYEYSFEYNTDNKVSSFTETLIYDDPDAKPKIVSSGKPDWEPVYKYRILREKPKRFKMEYSENHVDLIREDGEKISYPVNNMGYITSFPEEVNETAHILSFDGEYAKVYNAEYNEDGRLTKVVPLLDNKRGETVEFVYSPDGALISTLRTASAGPIHPWDLNEKTTYTLSKYENINGLFIPTFEDLEYDQLNVLGQLRFLGLASSKLPREVVRENDSESVRYRYEYTFDNKRNVTSCKIKIKRTDLESKKFLEESLTLKFRY